MSTIASAQVLESAAASGLVTAVEQAEKSLAEEGIGAATTAEGSVLFRAGTEGLEIQIPKPSSAQLAAAKPSTWKAKMGTALRAGAAEAYRKFLPDSFAFMVALGLVAAKDTVFNYAQNPAAFDQLLDGQTNLPSQMGFAAFIATNAATGKFFEAAMRDRSYRPMGLKAAAMQMRGLSVSALGMIGGTLMSETVSGGVNGAKPLLKQMRACIFKNSMADCDSAHLAFSELFHKNLAQMAPGLMSQIAGAFISSGIRTAVTLGGTALLKQAAKALLVNGVKIGFEATEGGALVETGMWIAQVGEMAGMVDLSASLENWIKKPWENQISTGPRVAQELSQINALTSTAKNALVADYGLKELLFRYAKDIEDLRSANSANSSNAYNQWARRLTPYTTQYLASQKFYNYFLEQIWSNHFGPAVDRKNILRLYPLFGVNISDGQGGGKQPLANDYLVGADEIEQAQVQYLQSVLSQIQEDYRSPAARLSAGDQQKVHDFFLTPLSSLLTSQPNLKAAANGLSWLKDMTSTHPQAALPLFGNLFSDWMSQNATTSLERYMFKIKSLVGEPFPCLNPGQGFARMALLNLKENQDDSNPFAYSGAEQTDFYLEKMLSGAGDESKVNTASPTGLPAFNPPSIRRAGPLAEDFNLSALDYSNAMAGTDASNAALGTLFNHGQPAFIDQQKTIFQKRYTLGSGSPKNIVELLENNGVRSDILNAGSRPTQWWSSKIEPRFLSVWSQATLQYGTVAAQYLRELNNTEVLHFAQGRIDLPTGILALHQTEFETYVQLLDRNLPPTSQVKAAIASLRTNFYNLLKSFKSFQLAGNFVLGSANKTESKAAVDNATQALKDLTSSLQNNTRALAVTGLVGEHILNTFNNLYQDQEILNVAAWDWHQTGAFEASKCTKMASGASLKASVQGSGCH